MIMDRLDIEILHIAGLEQKKSFFANLGCIYLFNNTEKNCNIAKIFVKFKIMVVYFKIH